MARFKHPLQIDPESDSENDFEYEPPDPAKTVPNATGTTDSVGENETDLKQPNACKYLYPTPEFVQELRPEETRWFYKDSTKKWTPFIGYDSQRIECKYREVQHNASKSGKQFTNDERICVRGSLYECSVIEMKCFPIYWEAQGTSNSVYI